MPALMLGDGSSNVAQDNMQGLTKIGPKNVTTGKIVDGPVRFNGIHAVNEGTETAYLQFFNDDKVGDVTLGKTVPLDVLVIPAANWEGEFMVPGKASENYGINAPAYALGLIVAATKSRNGNDLVNYGDVFANFKITAIGV